MKTKPTSFKKDVQRNGSVDFNSDRKAEFLDRVPVFTLGELTQQIGKGSGRSIKTAAYNLVKNRRRVGKLGVIKEGVYYAIRPGATAQTASVDEFLVASKLASDSILAFHTALDILGFGHSKFNTYYYLSKQYHRPVRFRGEEYRSAKTPLKLAQMGMELFGTTKIERLGVTVLTTDKERTLIEALEHPEYCGGFEETYRSLEKIPYLQPEIVLRYLDLRRQKNLYARVGFFLEQHRTDFRVDDSFLAEIAQMVPVQPVYWIRRAKGVLSKRWNLIVPEAVVHRNWEEF